MGCSGTVVGLVSHDFLVSLMILSWAVFCQSSQRMMGFGEPAVFHVWLYPTLTTNDCYMQEPIVTCREVAC